MIARAAWTAIFALALLLAGCGEPKPKLAAVPVPDVAAAEPSVRAALTEARAQFDRLAGGKTAQTDLANAYGELAMAYQAHSVIAPAEAAYRNAMTLAPTDKRWPYLLGHLYNDAGRMEEAIKSFEAALAIDGNDGPIVFSLAEVSLQHGDLDRAEQLYAKLQARTDERPAALAGLGKVALARRDYKLAIERFEEALKLSPESTRLRQPLATAYRATGDRARAEQNLALYSVEGFEPQIVDPAVEQMGAKAASSRALYRRGKRAIEAGRFDLAETSFRAAAEADPKDAGALAFLGLAQVNLGRDEEASRTLEKALSLDPGNPLAHLSLGVAYDRRGLDDKAREQYEATLQHDPANAQARVYLADAQMRLDQPAAAVELYRQVLADTPDALRIQLSLAMALVKAKRFADARKALEGAFAAQSNNASIGNALARLLATSPDSAVRNGARAQQLSKALFESTRHPEAAQTYAMALAETGRFDEAVALQLQTLRAVERQAPESVKQFMQKNLALYQSHKPVRAGWSDDDPAMKPRSAAASRGARNS
jgi:tetratricopeptide (TPR) repeat protein